MYREELNRRHHGFLFHQLKSGSWWHCAISALTESRVCPVSSTPSPMQPRSSAVVTPILRVMEGVGLILQPERIWSQIL